MTYFVGGLAVLFLGVGVGLAIWVAKLKDRINDLEVSLKARHAVWLEAGNQITLLRDERDLLQGQLAALRSKYSNVLSKIESGAYCSAEAVAAALRGGPR